MPKHVFWIPIQDMTILTEGFRPFFLLAALWGALAMALWVPMLAGAWAPPSRLNVIDWHVHELLYGYLPAVLAGFLLTAVPSWTGRAPLAGPPLLALAAIWLAGRVAVLVSAGLGAGVAVVIDGAFLAALVALAGREIVASRNWRSLVVVVLVAALLAGNLVFHLESLTRGYAASGYGARIGTAVAVMLIALIGGRIVPAFTRNWLATRAGGRLPSPFEPLDRLALAAAAVALAVWVAAPAATPSAWLLMAAGLLHALRLARWSGTRTLREPLVTVLHAGYAFVPLGFVLVGVARLAPGWLAPSAAVHAWTAGAIGVMTLAVMTRASLGHTGRPLRATAAIGVIYGLALAAALSRIAAGIVPGQALMHLAAVAWIAAFALFAVRFAPVLFSPRV